VQLLNIKRRKDGNKVGVEFLACVDCSTFEFIRAGLGFSPTRDVLRIDIDDVARTFYYWVAAAVIPPITHTHRELNLIKMCV
jgi:hypothetical protein